MDAGQIVNTRIKEFMLQAEKYDENVKQYTKSTSDEESSYEELLSDYGLEHVSARVSSISVQILEDSNIVDRIAQYSKVWGNIYAW